MIKKMESTILVDSIFFCVLIDGNLFFNYYISKNLKGVEK